MSKWEYPEITVDEFYQGGLEAVNRKTRGALQRIDVYLGLYQDWSIWEDYPAEYGRSSSADAARRSHASTIRPGRDRANPLSSISTA